MSNRNKLRGIDALPVLRSGIIRSLTGEPPSGKPGHAGDRTRHHNNGAGMTDIVARLRVAIHMESAAVAPRSTLLMDAARDARDEIERLRAENGRLRAVLATHGWLSDRADEQRTPEQDAALQELVDQAQELNMGYGPNKLPDDPTR